MSRKIFRLVALLVIPSAVLTFILTDQYFKVSTQIKSVPGYLVSSNSAELSSLRPSFSSRIYFARETEAIMAVVHALEGNGPDQNSELDPQAKEYLSSHLPMRLLLYKTFSESRFASCRRLARLHGGSPSELLLCALMLEEGRRQESRAAWQELPLEDRNSWLGRRIGKQLTLAEKAGKQELIPAYDRHGRILGSVTDGKLEILPSIAEFLPSYEALEKSILRAGISPGGGIRTTIDLKLQQVAAQSLEGYRGSVVLVKPDSGEILAAASDTRTLRRKRSAPFSQQYEPASISKLITSSAAIRNGIDADSFMENTVCYGGKRYSGKILWCSFRSGRLETLARALAHSCNIAFADLGIAAGRKAVIDELLLFGFDRPPAGPFNFGRIINRRGDDRQLADLSIGLEETTITPIHGALVAATFANDGIMPEPSLLAAKDGLLGISPEWIDGPPGSRIIPDREALREITGAMEEVAVNGTGQGLSHDGFRIAMKTGTGSTTGTGYVTNYIGFGPLPDAQVAFCVRVTHQRTSSRVRRATRHVMTDLIEQLNGTRLFEQE